MPQTTTAPPSVIRNASWNSFATLWNIAISFVLTPLLITNLGISEYGILLLIWSVTGILGIVNLGMGEATLRFVAYYFGENDLHAINRVMGATLSFYLLICILASIITFFGASTLVAHLGIPPARQSEVSFLFQLTAIIFSIGVVSRAYGAIPMALQRYDITGKISIIQSVVRSIGYIILVALGYGLLAIVLWELVFQSLLIVINVIIVRRLTHGINLFPSFSFVGFREIFDFSLFSFLTYVFHIIHRESAKLVAANQVGVAAVAFIGTPDNIALRVHQVVAGGSETLMPCFSANRDSAVARRLFISGTWTAMSVTLMLFIPLVLLMPDFLALWISPDFSEKSATLGQLIAISYITQSAYTPTATYFRGVGKPWVVTVVILAAGCTTLLFSVLLIPIVGIIGIGYAYVLGSIPPLLGLVHGWIKIMGSSAFQSFLRFLFIPFVFSCFAYYFGYAVRSGFGNIGWITMFIIGAGLSIAVGVIILTSDLLLNTDDAPSRQFVQNVKSYYRTSFLCRFLS